MRRTTAFVTAFLVATVAPAWAATSFTLTFDGIPPAGTAAEGLNSVLGSDILGYYNGDPPVVDGKPASPRDGAQNYGVTFNAGTLAIAAQPAGSGQFSEPPTPPSAAGRPSGQGGEIILTLSQGLSLESLAFFYNALFESSEPELWLFSADGTRRYAQTLALCDVPGSDGFCGWTEFKLLDSVLDDLSGEGILINRVVWSATENEFVIDSVQMSTNGATPIPEPSTVALIALGLAAFAARARRR